MSQSYRYIAAQSIIADLEDEYSLNVEEYALLYSFYVTYSLCARQSAKKRTFVDYGWESNTLTIKDNGKTQSSDIGQALARIIDFNKATDFVFTEKEDLNVQFISKNLGNGQIRDCDVERAVIAKTSENNKYLKLFYRIRDGLAHGKFLLKFSSKSEKMVIIQDDDGHNVTARIVIKLSTLLNFVRFVDKNKIIYFNQATTNDSSTKCISVA